MPTVTELLNFEATWVGKSKALKEEAMRTDLGLPPARYYQLLGRVIETREALTTNPVLVHHLLRVRETRRTTRARRVA
jgi:hypothetical protein